MALADMYSDQAVEAKRSKAPRTREQDVEEEDSDGDLFDELQETMQSAVSERKDMLPQRNELEARRL